MEIIFLGTSSMVPTKERNQSSILVLNGAEGILIDCGEGTQRQFKMAGIPLTKVTKILISHWHGDHVLGLPGLLQTLNSSVTEHKIKIIGPKGTKQQLEFLKKAFYMEDKEGNLQIEVEDAEEGKFLDHADYYLEAKMLEHSVPCLGYNIVEKDKVRINTVKAKKAGLPEGPILGKLQKGEDVEHNGKKIKSKDITYTEKGKKLTIVMDTGLCNSAIQLAKNADMLICEATYANDLAEKAEQYKHLTARDAATIANKAQVAKLVLTHFSQRYKSTAQIEEDAKITFNSVVSAYDFMRITL